MLCVEDQIDALTWSRSIGGLKGLIARSNANLAALEEWVAQSDWAAFLADDPATRSNTSVCLKIAAPAGADRAKFAARPRRSPRCWNREGVALDIGSYRDAPPGLRIWCGATVETSDIAALTPWLDWAFRTVQQQFAKGAA